MTAGLWILAGLALQAGPGPGPGTVRGVVRDAADGRPLPNALVTLVGQDRSTISDGRGSYLFLDVPPGEYRVRASRLDFHPLSVRLDLPDDGTLEVDFLLTLRPVEMPVVEARASPNRHTDTVASNPEPAPVGTAVVRVLDATPGVAEAGLAAAVESILGPDPPSPDNVLFVRGAGATLDLILLDGAPVQAPFHLGGLIQPSVTPSVSHARRMHGGVSPRWDGGLSDVLLLESRSGEGTPARASVYLDMLSAGGLAEGGSPGRAGWLVSMRSLHGAGADPFIDDGLPQEYADGLVRLDLNAAAGDTLMITGFWNRETVHMDPEGPDRESPSWGNLAGALRYRGDLSIGRAELGAAYGEFDTQLPIGRQEPLTTNALSRRARLTADLTNRLGAGSIGYGLQADRLDQRTRFDGVRERTGEPYEVSQRADAASISGYVEGSWPVFGTTRISAGLRATSFSDNLGSGLSPRIRADVIVAPDVLFSVSAGRFRQLMVATGGVLNDVGSQDEFSEPAIPQFTRITAAKSDQFVVGVTHLPKSGSEVRVEGYWKRVDGLPDLNGGHLRYTGVDVWLRQALGPFQLWGAYSLGWALAVINGAPDEDLYSGRHLLRGGFTKGFGTGVRLDAELSYGQGLEFGTIPRVDRPGAFVPQPGDGVGTASARASRIPEAIPNFAVPVPVPRPAAVRAPQGSYLRLNVQATARIEARVFGRKQLLYPYFRIINALDRNDALFYRSEGDPGLEPVAVGAIPILPVIGVEWRL